MHGLHVLVVDQGVEAGVKGRDGVDTLVAADDGLAVGLPSPFVGSHLADDGRHRDGSLLSLAHKSGRVHDHEVTVTDELSLSCVA